MLTPDWPILIVAIAGAIGFLAIAIRALRSNF